MERLTKEQAAILGTYTGIACSKFSLVHEYAEKKLGRPILTHEFADAKLWEQLKELTRDDFLSICPKEQPK